VRILVVEFRDPAHPQAGGAEAVLVEVFSRIVAAGHSVDYLCCRPPGFPAEETVRGIRYLRRAPQAVFNYAVPLVYTRELRRNRYDVIAEGIDKIPFFLPLVERRVPVACIVPHLFGEAIFREASWPVASYVWLMERPIPAVYRRSLFSVLSETTRDDVAGRGVDRSRIRVIHPGLDLAAHTAPAAKPPRVRPTVLYVGRLKRYKGIELAIEAVARLRGRFPDIRFDIVGVGDHLDALRRRAAELGIADAVTFTGRVSMEEKVARMQTADVLVYTSPKEGWGLSVLEANACGTVVVASDSPGLREAVVEGTTGFLVPHGDVDALADRIARVLSDDALHARLRAGALEWASRFTWDRAASETLALLKEAARDKDE
jgi:glycosyltransferase involved in cell wall biosynthesis